MFDQLDLKHAKPAVALGSKEEGRTKEGHDKPLNEEMAHQYRATIARANYLAPDRSDIAFVVKELARRMSTPTEGDWARL